VSSHLTHLDESGAARMVDVGAKAETRREATAECLVRMGPDTIRAIRESELTKGDALGVARVAGIMAAKRTSELIPLCHPLPITSIAVDFELLEVGVRIVTTARVTGRTGVEMEALTAAAGACLAIYDMAKSLDRAIEIREIVLLEKTGGRSGTFRR
jgi:cyclic pyranopterin monophosphate synthase